MDLQNRLEGATPLHLAVKIEHNEARQGVVEMLLEAGADPRFVPPLPSLLQGEQELTRARRIKDKHNCIPAEYLNPDGNETDKAIIRSLAIAMAEFALGGADIASDGEDDGEMGSGSDSD